MFDLGAQELIVIFIVAFLVFGPKRLPELGRTLGKGIRELKAAMRNVKESIEESDLNLTREIKEVKSDLEGAVRKSIIPELSKMEELVKKEEENPAGEKINTPPVEEKKEKAESDKDG